MDGAKVSGRSTVHGENGQPIFVGQPWSIVGAGDFNRDGQPDILWHNSVTNETQICFMDGAKVSGRGTVVAENGQPAFVGDPWSVVGTGDFNPDSGADILWHNKATNETQIWFMKDVRVSGRGTVLGESAQPTFVGPPWSIAGANFFVRPAHAPPPPAPVVKTFDQGVTTDIAIGGSVQVVMKADGSFTFTYHAHDSGFDNIEYTIAAAVLTADGIVFTFQHSGHTEGTSAALPFGTPNRDDDFATGGSNPQIATEWPGIVNGSFMASIAGTDKLAQGTVGAPGDLVNELLSAAEKAAAEAIIALV